MYQCTPSFYKNACLLLLFIAVTCFARAQNGFSPQIQDRLQKVLDSIQNSVTNPVVGGMSVAIKVDDLAQWEGVSGYRARNINAQNELLPGGDLFRKETLSRMYSVTKTFTAPLVLQLAKEGFFSLEDPISKYLPIKQYNPGLNDQVTLRQLLGHESGYSEYLSSQQLQIAVAFQPERVWAAAEIIPFLTQIAPPGTERRYISSNYLLLGTIIELTTGKKVEALYRTRFFEPLGLNSMYLSVREAIGNRGILADPHDNISPYNPIFQFLGRPTFPDYITNVKNFPFTAIASLAFTGGGIVTNARDMAEWGSALFGGRATSESVLQTMLNSIATTPDADGDFLGYGLWTNKKVSETDYFVGHNGFAPGYRSLLFYQPDRKLTLSILVNSMSVDPYLVGKALYEAIPDFLCGNENRKEGKILLCHKGNTLCVDRKAAALMVSKGAYLGSCSESKKIEEKKATQAKSAEGRIAVYPNPFQQSAKVHIELGKAKGPVGVRLYNLEGRLVSHLFQGPSPQDGSINLNLDGHKLMQGTYLLRVETPLGTISQRVSKLR